MMLAIKRVKRQFTFVPLNPRIDLLDADTDEGKFIDTFKECICFTTQK